MKNVKICAFGDSVMKGTILHSTSPLEYSLPATSFTDTASDKLGVRIDNFARFGSTLRTGEKMLIRHMAGLKQYDYTLLKFGGNDCDYYWSAIAAEPDRLHYPNTPITEFLLSYEKLMDRVRQLGSKPVVLTLAPVEPVKYFRHITREFPDAGRENVLRWLGGTPDFIREWHEMYNLQLMGMAARLGVPAIDITSCFYRTPGYSALMCEDGAHPNEEGQALMAEALTEGLGRILQNDAAAEDGTLRPALC